jgi:hypothetical protein
MAFTATTVYYFYRPGQQKQVVAAGSVVRPAVACASCIAPFSGFHHGWTQSETSIGSSIWFVVSMPGKSMPYLLIPAQVPRSLPMQYSMHVPAHRGRAEGGRRAYHPRGFCRWSAQLPARAVEVAFRGVKSGKTHRPFAPRPGPPAQQNSRFANSNRGPPAFPFAWPVATLSCFATSTPSAHSHLQITCTH